MNFLVIGDVVGRSGRTALKENLKKIQDQLKFKTNFTIKDAVKDLKLAFEKKLLTNTLNNDLYFNIKRMNNITSNDL